MQKTVIQTKFTLILHLRRLIFKNFLWGQAPRPPRKHTFHILSKLYTLYKLYQPVLSPLTYIFIATPLSWFLQPFFVHSMTLPVNKQIHTCGKWLFKVIIVLTHPPQYIFIWGNFNIEWKYMVWVFWRVAQLKTVPENVSRLVRLLLRIYQQAKIQTRPTRCRVCKGKHMDLYTIFLPYNSS